MISKFRWVEARENCLSRLHPSTTPLVVSYTQTSTPLSLGMTHPQSSSVPCDEIAKSNNWRAGEFGCYNWLDLGFHKEISAQQFT